MAWSIVCDMPPMLLPDILLETVVNGTVLDCSPDTPLLSLDQVQSLGQDKIIDAQIIRDILTGKIVPAATPQPDSSQASPPPLDPRGIRIRGAWIRGDLDLDGIDTKIGLRLTACRLDAFTMQEASLRWLELDTCVLTPTTADRAQIGALTIRGCLLTGKCPKGMLRLANTHVTSDLRISSTRIKNAAGPAVMAEALNVGGSAVMDGLAVDCASESTGAMSLTGATITGQLSLRGTTLSNSSGPALIADSATVQGAAFLDQGFTATGTGRLGAVRFTEAKVSGMLTLCGATLANDTGPAFVADLLTAQGDMLMTSDASTGKPFKATGRGAGGTVRLRGANISGQLSLEKAEIFNCPSASGAPAKTAATKVPVGDKPPPRSAGAVSMTGAVVGRDLVLRGATLADDHGPALMADSATIQGAAYLDQSFIAIGTDEKRAAVHLADASIAKELVCSGRAVNRHPSERGLALSLALAKIGTLVYDLSFACVAGDAAHGLIDFDGLTYTGLPRLPKEQEHQNKKKPENEWISCLGKGRTVVYAAQPYQELAAAYQGAGNHDAARRVLIAQRDDARKRGRLSLLSKAGQWFLKILIGYGYRSTQALAWLAVLFILTALAAVFYFGPKELIVSVPATTSGQASPAAVECSVPGRISYAIEVAFPIVSLSGSSEEHCDLPATGAKSWLVAFGWIVRALAATLAAFYLAGLTGITRNS